MTSTNDGEDVKSNQTSGQKGKTYYINLYKTLDAQLNGEASLSERVAQLGNAWGRVHTLCLHSVPSTHPHLLAWIQRHTARTVLQSEWQSPTSKDEHAKLKEILDAFAEECRNASSRRNGVVLPWEGQLLDRAEWFKGLLENPWGHPVLKAMLDSTADKPTTEEIIEWLKEDRGVVFAARLRQLALSKCEDLALDLLTAVMDRVRACKKPVSDLDVIEQSKATAQPEPEEPTFESILASEAGFADVWEVLTDTEFVLLHKSDKNARLIELAKQVPISHGYQVVERLLSRPGAAPRERRLWKNVKDVAALVAQVIITRCMVVPLCTGAVRSALHWMGRALVRAVPAPALPRATAALAAPAVSARHLHTLAHAVHAQQSTVSSELQPFVVELYVRAITFGMNELEKLKLKPEYEKKEARSAEQTLASWFVQLGGVLAGSARMQAECTLTAFSVHPSPQLYERVRATPPVRSQDTQKPVKEENTSEFGSWAQDSRSHTNFVKTSSHLNMQQTQQQANVLSTALLGEGDALGLGAELSQDVAVLLSGPRVKTLCWDMDREELLSNCRGYMERTAGGTRALTTELKYLNLDPRHYLHLPEERDDEDDLYYGIEKGYEHLLELEPQPEEIWQDTERTETAGSSDEDKRHKIKQVAYTSGSDSDPLSLVVEKREKKRSQKHKDKHSDRRKDDKEKKKEKKERKKREKKIRAQTSLDNLIGVKLTRDATNTFADSAINDKRKMSRSESGSEVVYDGQFSMDEIKTPKSTDGSLESSEIDSAVQQLALQDALNQCNESLHTETEKTKLVTPVTPNFDKKVVGEKVREEVKKSITKLIQFRRNKTSESTNSSPGTPRSPMSLGSLSPLIGTKLSTSASLQLNKKQNDIPNIIKKHSKPRTIKQTCSRVKPFNPELYRRKPINNLLDRACFQSDTALNLSQGKPEVLSSNLTKSSQSQEELRPPYIPPLTSNPPQSSDPHERTHMSSYERFLQQWQRDPGAGVLEVTKPIKKTKKKKEIKPISRVIPVVPNVSRPAPPVTPKVPNTLKNNTTVSPDEQTVIDSENRVTINTPTAIKSETRLSLNSCSLLTQNVNSTVKTDPPISSPSAKTLVQPKKMENAPNTFARLSYMHKNKLNDKSKQLIENTTSLQTSISEELDRRIAELKLSKLLGKNKDIEYRIGTAQPPKPKVPPKVVIEKIEPQLPSETLNAQHPLLVSILKNAGLVVTSSNNIQKVSNDNPLTYTKKTNLTEKNQQGVMKLLGSQNTCWTRSNEIQKVPNENLSSNANKTALTEKDQQDLLKLLGQQSLLNRPSPQDKIFPQTNKIVNSLHDTSTTAVSSRTNPTLNTFSQSNTSVLSDRLNNSPKPVIVQNPATLTVESKQNQLTQNIVQFPEITKTTIIKTTAMVQNKTQVRQPQNEPKQRVQKRVVVQQDTALGVNKPVFKKYVPKPPIPVPKYVEHVEAQDWTKVLDTLRAQKTPSRGPNALDMTFNKDSFEKVSERNQQIICTSVANKSNNTIKQAPIFQQVKVPVSAQPKAPMSPQVRVPPSAQVKAPMSPQVRIPTSAQVKSPMSPQIGVLPSPQIKAPMSPQVGAPPSPLIASMSPRVGVPQSSQIKAPMSPKIGVPPSPQIKTPLSPQVGAPPTPQIKASMSSQVRITTSGQTKAPMSPQVQVPCSPQIKAPLSPLINTSLPLQKQSAASSTSSTPVYIQSIPETILKKSPITLHKEVPKQQCQQREVYKEEDYVLLEQLMDDDLRQEIGELPSDDESHPQSHVLLSKCSANKVLVKGQTIFKKNTAAISKQIQDSHRTKASEVNQPLQKPPKTTPQAKPKLQIISNEKVDIRDLSHKLIGAKLIRQDTTTIKLPITTMAPKLQPGTIDGVKNTLTSTNMNSTNPTASYDVPQPVQNMVIIDPHGVSSQNYLGINTTNVAYKHFASVESQIIIGSTYIPAVNSIIQTGVVYNEPQIISTNVPILHLPEPPASKPIVVHNNSQSLQAIVPTIHLPETTAALTFKPRHTEHKYLSVPCLTPFQQADDSIKQCESTTLKKTNTDTKKIFIDSSAEKPKPKEIDSNTNKAPAYSQLSAANPKSYSNIKSDTCARKVLSEVQENLAAEVKVTEKNEPLQAENQRGSVEPDIKKEEFGDIERLVKKRLAIINRDINQHCFHPPIPLTYTTLQVPQATVSTRDNALANKNEGVAKILNNKEIKTCVVAVKNANTPQESNEIKIHSDDIRQKNQKEFPCRRILLRSSNKLDPKIIVPAIDAKLVNQNSKVRLKEDHKSQNHPKTKDKVLKLKLDEMKAELTKDVKEIQNESNSVSPDNTAGEKIKFGGGNTKVVAVKKRLPAQISKRITNKQDKKSREKRKVKQFFTKKIKTEKKKNEKLANYKTENKPSKPGSNDEENIISMEVGNKDANKKTEKDKLVATATEDYDFEDEIVGALISKTVEPCNEKTHCDQSTDVKHPIEKDTAQSVIIDRANKNGTSLDTHQNEQLVLISTADSNNGDKIAEPTKDFSENLSKGQTEKPKNKERSTSNEKVLDSPLVLEEVTITTKKLEIKTVSKPDCVKTNPRKSVIKEDLHDAEKPFLERINIKNSAIHSTNMEETDAVEANTTTFDIMDVVDTTHVIPAEKTKESNTEYTQQDNANKTFPDVTDQTLKNNVVNGVSVTKEFINSSQSFETINKYDVITLKDDSAAELVKSSQSYEKKLHIDEITLNNDSPVNKMEESKELDNKTGVKSINKKSKINAIKTKETVSLNTKVSSKESMIKKAKESKSVHDNTSLNAAKNPKVNKDATAKPAKRKICGKKNKNTSITKTSKPKATHKHSVLNKSENLLKNQTISNSKKQLVHEPEIIIPDEAPFINSIIENKDLDVINLSSDADLDLKINENMNCKDNHAAQSVNKFPTNDIPQSYKDSIQIKEVIVPENKNPFVKYVEIKFPDNRKFKATVRGRLDVTFDVLFDQPELRGILLNNFDKKKLLHLNIHQRRKDAKIQDINVTELPDTQRVANPIEMGSQLVETVDLISDDEDEPQTIATKPETVVTEPETIATEPQTTSTEPNTIATEPQTVPTEPETIATVPETIATEPQTFAYEPQTFAFEPQTFASEPQTIATEHGVFKLITNLDQANLGIHKEKLMQKCTIELYKCDAKSKSEELVNALLKDLNVTLPPTTDEVIEIDDSSEGENDDTGIDLLKNLLLRDLGVTDISQSNATGVQQDVNHQIPVQEQRPSRTRKSKYHRERDSRPSSMEEQKCLPNKAKKSKNSDCDVILNQSSTEDAVKSTIKEQPLVMTRDCSVKLVNCDSLVKKINKNVKLPQDCIIIDGGVIESDDDNSSLISDSGSFSILNEMETFDELIANKDRCTSPVIDVFETMYGALHKNIEAMKDKVVETNTENAEPHTFNDNIASTPEWMETRRKQGNLNQFISIDCIFEEIVKNKHDTSTDCETGTDASIAESETICTDTVTVPTLKSIMAKCFENNPIIYQMKPIAKINDFQKIKTKPCDATCVTIAETDSICTEIFSVPTLKSLIAKYFVNNSVICLKHPIPKTMYFQKKPLTTIQNATNVINAESENICSNFFSVPSLKSILVKYLDNNAVVYQKKPIAKIDVFQKTPLDVKQSETDATDVNNLEIKNIYSEIFATPTLQSITAKYFQNNPVILKTKQHETVATDVSNPESENICFEIFASNLTHQSIRLPTLQSIMATYFEDNPIVYQMKPIVKIDIFQKKPLKTKPYRKCVIDLNNAKNVIISTELFSVPSLTSIMVKYFEANPIPVKTNYSKSSLKRKLIDSLQSVSKKVTKMPLFEMKSEERAFLKVKSEKNEVIKTSELCSSSRRVKEEVRSEPSNYLEKSTAPKADYTVNTEITGLVENPTYTNTYHKGTLSITSKESLKKHSENIKISIKPGYESILYEMSKDAVNITETEVDIQVNIAGKTDVGHEKSGSKISDIHSEIKYKTTAMISEPKNIANDSGSFLNTATDVNSAKMVTDASEIFLDHTMKPSFHHYESISISNLLTANESKSLGHDKVELTFGQKIVQSNNLAICDEVLNDVRKAITSKAHVKESSSTTHEVINVTDNSTTSPECEVISKTVCLDSSNATMSSSIYHDNNALSNAQKSLDLDTIPEIISSETICVVPNLEAVDAEITVNTQSSSNDVQDFTSYTNGRETLTDNVKDTCNARVVIIKTATEDSAKNLEITTPECKTIIPLRTDISFDETDAAESLCKLHNSITTVSIDNGDSKYVKIETDNSKLVSKEITLSYISDRNNFNPINTNVILNNPHLSSNNDNFYKVSEELENHNIVKSFDEPPKQTDDCNLKLVTPEKYIHKNIYVQDILAKSSHSMAKDTSAQKDVQINKSDNVTNSEKTTSNSSTVLNVQTSTTDKMQDMKSVAESLVEEIIVSDENCFKIELEPNNAKPEIRECITNVVDNLPFAEQEDLSSSVESSIISVKEDNVADRYVYVEEFIETDQSDDTTKSLSQDVILENDTDVLKSDDKLVCDVESVCKDQSGVIFKGIECEDYIYIFPITKVADRSGANNTLNKDVDAVKEEEFGWEEELELGPNSYDEPILIIPKRTYSKRRLKRKSKITDEVCCLKRSKRISKSRESSEFVTEKKNYRRNKYIDLPAKTEETILDFKRCLDYYSAVKFSYSISFDSELIEVSRLLNKWPISGPLINYVNENIESDDHVLFTDLHNNEDVPRDPYQYSLAEEITAIDIKQEYLNCPSEESCFSMGFGEGSGRVKQNLDGGIISNVSAATLSDVKQTQPCLPSEKYNCLIDKLTSLHASEEKQLQIINRFISFIQIREKVRSFFRKSTLELTRDFEETCKKGSLKNNEAPFPFELFNSKYIEHPPFETIVQVVQVGQPPVSAAAQNPVTCDPRVTQVSDASPSQCSVENSPQDDSQPPIKTEYTELTTADLSLPLVDDYVQHNQTATVDSQYSNMPLNTENIPIQTELVKSEVKIELEEIDEKENSDLSETNSHFNNADYIYDTNNTNETEGSEVRVLYNSDKQETSEIFIQQKTQNGSPEKTDQIAHAMNAAGITTTSETVNTRAQALVNLLSQKLRQGTVVTASNPANNLPKTTPLNAMSLQQALAQILPPPLNQTSSTENNQQGQNNVTPQVLHIVQGKNASGNQITLVDNTHQPSVISTPNATPVLHIVQNKATTPGQNLNGSPAPQSNTFSGISLVDAGLQQGGNQLLHIVNTGNQKNNNAGQLLKRVNLLTNLTNVQGSNEQKMVQFVCKSADGKSIQLNAPHQRSMVLRLQPIESPNVQPTTPKPAETNQDPSPAQTASNAVPNKDTAASQQEIKSRSVYEENYAKFIQNSSNKPTLPEKPNSLPKFNQAFGKAVFQDGNQKQNELNSNNLPSVNTVNNENSECPATDNAVNIDHIGQIGSPPLLLRKPPAQTSQAQPSIVQQIKQTIAPMNLQTMHGGVIYTRQIPVNIGGGQTINLITVPSTDIIDESGQKLQGTQGESIEPSIIKIVPQNHPPLNAEVSQDELNGSNDNTQQNPPQPQPVLTQMRIKLPMLSKTSQIVSGARVVRPSFFQIQRNVIGGANQVYQQLVLTAAPPLGQQTIRLPQAQARQVKVPENQSSSESQMSSSTLEQLREFDMVLEQVKERSTVQPINSNSGSSFKLHTSSSTSTTDSPTSSITSSAETTQVLYSIGNSQPLNVAYVSRKSSVTTPTTSNYVRSPDSSGMADSPTSSTHSQIPHTSTSEATSSETTAHQKPAKVSSKSKSRPKSSSHSHSLKLNSVPPKTSAQKPLEDEQTTQRILYILAEYKEQVENSPDKDKPAPRRRSNPPSNPSGSSKRKKSSSGSRRSGRDLSPLDDSCRTMGSEDSSCGTSQGDCTESCLDSHSPEDSPRKVARKLTFEQESPTTPQPRPQPQRNVIVADGQTITVARGTAGKPATAVLMPANYILPVSMVKGGQQIAIVTNRGPKLLTVGGGEGGATNALLLQRLIGPAGLKPVLTRPGVRHVRLPTAALHNLQAFNLTTATTVQPPDSTASPAPEPTPPDLVQTNRADHSPWTDRESEVKPDRASSPDESEPWNLPSSCDPHDYSYEETVRSDNMDRTVLDPIPDRYSPDMEAQRIFDKMFDVDAKKSYIDSPRCAYDIETSDCDDKPYQVVHKKDNSHRQTRLAHVSAAALRHKYAVLEHELRLQKSLSEECEDLGVDSPSASELFPEAELLFAASPAQEHGHDTPQHSHTPQPTLNQSVIQPDIDDQIATDQLIPRHNVPEDRQELNLGGLEDVGIVTVSGDGLQAAIALDQEEFARAHPNTTFHSEPTDAEEVQPFAISSLKSRHITSTIFHSNRAPATVLMTAPQTTVISQAAPETSQNPVKYSEINNMIHSIPSTHTNNINLSSVLVKDDGLTRFDNILTDSRELHLSNTASAIVHPTGNATQVIRRVCYDENKRERESFLMDEPDAIIAGDDAKMVAEDSSRDATLESMAGDVDDDNSSPERHAELFWESNSASERSESRRPLDFSSDSEKCCKSPSYDETNSTDSSGVGTHLRLDSVIKEARGVERSGSADGSSADDTHPPLRTYPPKRSYHVTEEEMERSLSGKTRAGERSPDLEVRRRASGRGVVKRGCHCCNGSPAPQRPKKPRPRKPNMDFAN